MSSSQLADKLKDTKRKLYNAEARGKYHGQFVKEAIYITDKDHDDLKSMFKHVKFYHAKVPEHIQLLWEEQSKALQTKYANGFRWHPEIIRQSRVVQSITWSIQNSPTNVDVAIKKEPAVV